MISVIFENRLVVNQLLYAGHAIVVSFDQVSLGRTAGLNRIGIDRSLSQNPVAVELFQYPVLHADELLADLGPLAAAVA